MMRFNTTSTCKLKIWYSQYYCQKYLNSNQMLIKKINKQMISSKIKNFKPWKIEKHNLPKKRCSPKKKKKGKKM